MSGIGTTQDPERVELDGLDAYMALRGLAVPESLRRIYASDLPTRLGSQLCRAGGGLEAPSFASIEALIDSSDWPLLPNLVPLMIVDESSFACVVASDLDRPAGEGPLPGEGAVVRWHLQAKGPEQQAVLLDTDCFEYATSIADELAARTEGLDRMLDVIGPAYQEHYLNKEKRPRDFIVRPVRIACQNVIMGLGAIAQDSSFDGLSVVAWQTCEAPHVAAHEGNRALAALTLCDAFQNGGTMEVRFDRDARIEVNGKTHHYRGHPEGGVPASLRRYARTVGVDLGPKGTKSISPAKARELFRAITPMPEGLQGRVDHAVNKRGISPERLYFTLLSPVWRDIELDFLLATSSRVESILGGGAGWEERSARQAESEACRAAIIAGMLFRRLNATDTASSDGGARVVEDLRRGVQWEVLPDLAAVRFSGLEPGTEIPWASGAVSATEFLTVFPRSFVTADVTQQITALNPLDTAALVLPRQDSEGLALPADVLCLRCPDRLSDIDKAVEEKLLKARTSRG